jgi:hypothetical protein
MKKLLLTIVILGAIAGALASASYNTTRWGGSYGYNTLEYELTFKDTTGRPIEGIELKVEDRRGEEFFCFPVTDYVPGQTPKSGKDGVLQFHHVMTGVEWDNYGWSLFWCIPIATTRSPVYVCRFLRGGQEVLRIPYGELPYWDWPGRGWEQVPKVKRSWNWSTTIPNEITYRVDDTLDSHPARLRQFFHDDGDGKPNREVAVACRNARSMLFKLDGERPNGQDAFEDIEFPVIRRTIVVELPGEGQ